MCDIVLTVTGRNGSIPFSSRGTEDSRVSLENIAEVAHELHHVAEAVCHLIGQDSTIFRCGKCRAHPGNTGLVVPVGVAVAKTGLGFRDIVLGGSVLGKQVKANIAHAVEGSRTKERERDNIE